MENLINLSLDEQVSIEGGSKATYALGYGVGAWLRDWWDSL